MHSLIGMGRSSGGCRGVPDPLLLPIIGISLARSNLYEIAVKSSIIFIKGPLFYLFLRLVQINVIFSANVHILYISLSLSIYVTIYFI
jgi:hypothetical protein